MPLAIGPLSFVAEVSDSQFFVGLTSHPLEHIQFKKITGPFAHPA